MRPPAKIVQWVCNAQEFINQKLEYHDSEKSLTKDKKLGDSSTDFLFFVVDFPAIMEA